MAAAQQMVDRPSTEMVMVARVTLRQLLQPKEPTAAAAKAKTLSLWLVVVGVAQPLPVATAMSPAGRVALERHQASLAPALPTQGAVVVQVLTAQEVMAAQEAAETAAQATALPKALLVRLTVVVVVEVLVATEQVTLAVAAL